MTQPKQIKQLALIAILLPILISLMVWLVSGSSNQAQLLQWQDGWQTTTPFKYARRAPAAAAYEGYLYLSGGVDAQGNYIDAVEYAAILDNGQLGPWQSTSSLIEGRFYHSLVAYQGYLYAIGGGSGLLGQANYPLASVEKAKIQPDGSLGEWQTEKPLTLPRRGLKVVQYQNTLYAIGGYSGIFLRSVERTQISDEGQLDTWQAEEQLSIIDRYIHSSAIHNKVIYLLGGHMQSRDSASYGDIEISHIRPDGRLRPWQIEPQSLIESRLVAEAFVLGNFLYIAGGHSGNERLNSVEHARIGADGHIGPWRQSSRLATPRSAAAVATFGKYVYLLGGGGGGQPLNSVDMASQHRSGRLGVPIVPAQN